MRQALKYFIDRVEAGTARSTRTYNMYKDLLNSTTAGAAMLKLAKAVRILHTYDDFSIPDDCGECWPDGVPAGYAAARRELAAALSELAEMDE